MKSLNLKKGIPIALYNGGIVLEYGTTNVLSINAIKKEECMQMLQLLVGLNITSYIYTFNINRDPILLDEEKRIEENVYGIGEQTCEYDVNGIKILWKNDTTELEGDINAILIDKTLISDRVMQILMNEIKKIEDVEYTDSGAGFLELKKSGVHKGQIVDVLKIFVEKNRRKRNDTINVLAIGDNDNDLELLERADIGIVVANASHRAIEAADYICEKESAEGFLDMLNAIKIAKKYYGDK